MRKIYTLILCFFVGMLFVKGQMDSPIPKMKSLNNYYSTYKKTVNNKTVTCIDSIRYPQSKLSGVPEAGPLTNNTAAQSGISQAYHFSGNGTIHGIGAYLLLDFDGVPNNFSPVVAQIKVYNIDGQNYPTTPIDSAMVQVSDVGFNEQVLMFPSPIAVSDSFAISIEMSTFNAVTDTIWYTTNVCGWNGSICTVGDGNNENLSCVLSPDYVSANGSSWFNNNIEVFGWNIDMLMHPIFEQTFSSSYIVDTNLVCLGNTVTFTNTTMVNNNPMFNPTPNTYSLNLADLTVVSLDTNYTHLYAAPGSYSTVLTSTQYGYSANCVDSASMNVTVVDTATAYYGWTDMGGGTFQFSDSSMNATSWIWDFGDGSPTDTNQNPLHTYAFPGDYYVCLSVSGMNACNVNMHCDSVSFTVGIDDFYAADYVKLYPIPANKYFNVTVPSNYYGGEIVITDVVGQKVKIQNIHDQEKIKILTDEINSGVYFVSIDYNGERVFTQRIVIDK